ncbi:MAG: hypothetical protein C0592_04695 [Marinilabiliales bacterium]|nr:MAG: hypothetical protein C0592_04695 [Marinilabiliales bacterium]
MSFAQGDDWFNNLENVTQDVEEPMLYYERFNSFTEGDSVRRCDKRPCNGIIKDYYENGVLKHKGYYESGRLITGYENYYDNEQLERNFKIIGTGSALLTVYYKDGTLRSRVEYRKKNAIKWEDYYPNGNIEFIEEYDKKMQYYIKYNFYYMNGNPQNILELVDEKERIYTSKEYYRNGSIKCEGLRQQNASMGDYVRIGEWKFYNDDGTLKETVNYYKGEEIEEDIDDL